MTTPTPADALACPVCGGEGRVYRMTPTYEAMAMQSSGSFGWTGPTHEWRTCRVCGGAGVIAPADQSDLRAAARAALPGHPSPDRGSGPWVLRLVCCGYDDGIERYATWDEADTFRQAYVTGPGGHDRAAILTRDLDTTYHRRRAARRAALAPADPTAGALPAGPWTGDPADYDGDEGR